MPATHKPDFPHAIAFTPMPAESGEPVKQADDGVRVAQARARRDRTGAWAALNDLFRAGTPPTPPLNGRYAGELVMLDIAPGLTSLVNAITSTWLPWKGKTFNATHASGDNLFTRASLWLAHLYWPLYRGYVDDGRETYRAFAFRTYTAAGLADPDRQVFKIDYDLPENPGLSIRRVLDEVVQVADGAYLGKAHVKWWWGSWQLVAYFMLRS
jgi:hypothetical protein